MSKVKCSRIDCKFINEKYECSLKKAEFSKDNLDCLSYKPDRKWNKFVIKLQSIMSQEDNVI